MKAQQPTAELDPVQASAMLADVHARPTIVNIANAARSLLPQRARLASVPLRLGCLSSFTFDPLKPALELQALRAGFAAETYIAPFGQFDQEMINPASGLAAFKPDAVLLAIRLQDVCPAIHESFNSLSAEAARQTILDWIDRLHCALLAFRRHNKSHLLIQNYDLPATPALGVAEATSEHSQTALLAGANEKLAAIARSTPNTYVLDYDALVARHGRLTWIDPRLALFGRIPIAPANYWAYAGSFVRHIRPLYGLTKKAIVVDADNTLWGGIIGDAGLGGIALGLDYPGNAYVAFQKRLLDLHKRGVLLCLASKNEPDSVEDVLAKHPAMVLRREHFAAMRVNWRPKPENVREMAEELNFGLDSFVFLDDSPVECELMRTALPPVLSICLPAEPAELPGLVDALDCFDQWTVSAEDRDRGGMYRAEAERRGLAASAIDLPTFYRQLQMRMAIAVNDPRSVARVAQMTQRTNQFNMNTVRCTEDQIRRYMADAAYRVVTLALTDRFGENGIVGLAIVRVTRREWFIEMLLMSCRILGRTVEQCFIQWIAGQARTAGASILTGLVVLTVKNKPFLDFYRSCGFKDMPGPGSPQYWQLDLAVADAPIPDWMQIVVESAAEKPA